MEDREPCPWRIFDDVGGAFLLGCLGGSVVHAIKGFRNAPKGAAIRMAFSQVRARSPVTGGNFAVWGGLFTIFDCSLAHIRRTEDAWNAIAAGAITGGLLAARAGPKAIVRSAVVGAALLAVIEGLSLFIQRKIAEYQKDMARKQWEAIHGKGAALDLEDHLDPPVAPPVWHGDALPGDAGAAGIQGLDYGVDRA